MAIGKTRHTSVTIAEHLVPPNPGSMQPDHAQAHQDKQAGKDHGQDAVGIILRLIGFADGLIMRVGRQREGGNRRRSQQGRGLRCSPTPVIRGCWLEHRSSNPARSDRGYHDAGSGSRLPA